MIRNTYRVVSAHKVSIVDGGVPVTLRPGRSVELSPDAASALGARVQLLHAGTAAQAAAASGKPAPAPRPKPDVGSSGQDSSTGGPVTASDAATQGASVDLTDSGGSDKTHALHNLNTSDAVSLVMRAETLESVDALEEVEKANQKHEGGRKGVLKAIEARREALKG